MPGSFSRSFSTVDVLRFFAQRKRLIHFRKFPVSTALPRQFCKNGQASVLFRLASINLHLASMNFHFDLRSAYRGQRTGAPAVPFKPSLFQRTPRSRRPSDHTTARCDGTRSARAAPAGAKRFENNDVWVVRRIPHSTGGPRRGAEHGGGSSPRLARSRDDLGSSVEYADG